MGLGAGLQTFGQALSPQNISGLVRLSQDAQDAPLRRELLEGRLESQRRATAEEQRAEAERMRTVQNQLEIIQQDKDAVSDATFFGKDLSNAKHVSDMFVMKRTKDIARSTFGEAFSRGQELGHPVTPDDESKFQGLVKSRRYTEANEFAAKLLNRLGTEQMTKYQADQAEAMRKIPGDGTAFETNVEALRESGMFPDATLDYLTELRKTDPVEARSELLKYNKEAREIGAKQRVTQDYVQSLTEHFLPTLSGESKALFSAVLQTGDKNLIGNTASSLAAKATSTTGSVALTPRQRKTAESLAFQAIYSPNPAAAYQQMIQQAARSGLPITEVVDLHKKIASGSPEAPQLSAAAELEQMEKTGFLADFIKRPDIRDAIAEVDKADTPETRDELEATIMDGLLERYGVEDDDGNLKLRGSMADDLSPMFINRVLTQIQTAKAKDKIRADRAIGRSQVTIDRMVGEGVFKAKADTNGIRTVTARNDGRFGYSDPLRSSSLTSLDIPSAMITPSQMRVRMVTDSSGKKVPGFDVGGVHRVFQEGSENIEYYDANGKFLGVNDPNSPAFDEGYTDRVTSALKEEDDDMPEVWEGIAQNLGRQAEYLDSLISKPWVSADQKKNLKFWKTKLIDKWSELSDFTLFGMTVEVGEEDIEGSGYAKAIEGLKLYDDVLAKTASINTLGTPTE